MLTPGTQVPPLRLPTIHGADFDLLAHRPQAFSMLVVYRGYHCPVCKVYLGDLSKSLAEFQALGVEPVAITSDLEDRAIKAHEEWDLGTLAHAYALPIAKARDWGLLISKSLREAEPALFPEPGIFWVRPGGKLYASWVQTLPQARPRIEDLLKCAKAMIERGYPERGTA